MDQVRSDSLNQVSKSKMATRSSARSQKGSLTADQFVNTRRGKGRTSDSSSSMNSDKHISLSDSVAMLCTGQHTNLMYVNNESNVSGGGGGGGGDDMSPTPPTKLDGSQQLQ